MFEAVTRKDALAGDDTSWVSAVTVAAAVPFLLGLRDWAMRGEPLTLAIVYAPALAVSAWSGLRAAEGMSDTGRRRLSQLRGLLTLFYVVVFVYGVYRWSNGGDILLPAFALLYLVAVAWRFGPGQRGSAPIQPPVSS